jgi:hypothetical protein
VSLQHLKARCAACERTDMPMNKEHVFPQWLIQRTRTNETGIRWGTKRNVPALAATFPLCEECNKELGKDLEAPTACLFEEIEAGSGLSDNDAELLVRWMWKIKGLAWIAEHPEGNYNPKYTLRERVLLPIDKVRGDLILAGALTANTDPEFEDLPMGVDAVTEHDAIFVSGIFSRIAMMVLHANFENLVPLQFARYRLASKRDDLHAGKLFYPPASFRNGVEAVGVTRLSSIPLSRAHDRFAVELMRRWTQS